jgi:hypothetical protein
MIWDMIWGESRLCGASDTANLLGEFAGMQREIADLLKFRVSSGRVRVQIHRAAQSVREISPINHTRHVERPLLPRYFVTRPAIRRIYFV